MGTIIHCYDQATDKATRYPDGFIHDLSLVAAPEHIAFAPPSHLPKLDSRFAHPEEALSSPFVFVAQFNDSTDPFLIAPGRDAEARAVSVAGADYYWEQPFSAGSSSPLSIKKCLIWRTEADDHWHSAYRNSTAGWMLCIGRTSEARARGVLFQSFETTVIGNSNSRGHGKMAGMRGGGGGGGEVVQFEGGFILPDEVRTATIVAEYALKEDGSEISTISGKGKGMLETNHLEFVAQ